MKIAIVHELLTMKGGAERVLRVLADMYPHAPIYTLLYDEKKLGDWFPKERVQTPIFNFPFSIFPAPFRYNHHLYLSRFPKAVESWDFSEFDLVISTSSAFVHGIITNGAPKHLCYVHSPARYLWDRTHDVLEQAGKGFLGPLKRWYLERTFHPLRTWDAEVAARADTLLAASKTVQRRIELYWRRDSRVLHPPVDDFFLKKCDPPSTGAMERPHYYLVVSTLARYKRIDLAIAACNALGVHLKIVGDGPDRKRLEKLAGPNVEFYGYRSHDELRDLYTRAQAVLFPGDEDFGLVPLESMACGTPVIAYRSGGALETIIEQETGIFFDEPTAESLTKALQSFDRTAFDASACRKQAEKFSEVEFKRGIEQHVQLLITDLS